MKEVEVEVEETFTKFAIVNCWFVRLTAGNRFFQIDIINILFKLNAEQNRGGNEFMLNG